jgi:hypothetical protein
VPITQWEFIEDYSDYNEYVDFYQNPEQRNVALIDAPTVQKAQRIIIACETCSEAAETLFESVLDNLTSSDPTITDYILEIPARCPQCAAEINEKTLVDWDGAG